MIRVKTPPKELRVASTTGHVVILPASKTVSIPEAVVSDACARGCVVLEDGYDPDPSAQEPVYGKEAQERKTLNEVKEIIDLMLEDRKTNEWLDDGRPDAKAITRRRGKQTKAVHRDKVWAEHFANERGGDSK